MVTPVKGSPEFSDLFLALDKADKLFKKIDDVLECLADNPVLGDRIRFKQIPKSLKRKYGIENLFRIEINQDWRLLYTLVGWPKHKTVYVIFAGPHKEYDKLFGYD
jgi:mRNA-degrading endonuclease HigB of HigAB toxin-antitoxin module